MANKKDFPHPFGVVAKLYREMRSRLPAEVSNIGVNEFKGNFIRQGYRDTSGVNKWKPRKQKGKKVDSRAILIKSGRLKRSLRPKPDYVTARVVTDVPYAQLHNEGGKITGIQNVRSFRRKNSKKPVKAHTRKVNTTMPRRPFMITTEPLLNDIDKHYNKRLGEIWDKA